MIFSQIVLRRSQMRSPTARRQSHHQKVQRHPADDGWQSTFHDGKLTSNTIAAIDDCPRRVHRRAVIPRDLSAARRVHAAPTMPRPVAQMSSYPYGISSRDPLDVLERAGFEVRLSPHRRKHTPQETAALLGDADVLLAGTEPLPAEVIAAGGTERPG